MKKIILLLLLTASSVSFAQMKKVDTSNFAKEVEIGKVQPLGQPILIECTKLDNTYTFTYKDVEFTTLVRNDKFSFDDVDNAFEDFYKMIIEGFENTPKESIMLDVKDNFIWISYSKSFGVKLVRFSSSPKIEGAKPTFSHEFTQKQVEKLFGKKK